MPAHPDHYTNILRFWRAVETFSFPDVPKKDLPGNDASKDRLKTYVVHSLKPGDPLAWHAGELPQPSQGKLWRHTLRFHVLQKDKVIDLLARLTASTEYLDHTPGYTCGCALVVDEQGRPGSNTYAPAAFIHAIRLLREKRSPDQLADLLRIVLEQGNARFGMAQKDVEPPPVTWQQLNEELDRLRVLAGPHLPSDFPLLCSSQQVSAAAPLEAPFLNSYYLQDLDTLIQNDGGFGEPLRQFLMPQVDSNTRTDLLDPKALRERLHPRHLSAGRWPADPTHSLYSAQQAALAIALSKLRNDSGLLGINGPPGTGKTTLLREIIADTIVTRARRLLQSPVTDLFNAKWVRMHDKAGFYQPHEDIFGNDGIVVASNNNIAVENSSKEIPSIRSISRDAFPEANYFPEVAKDVLDDSCWGMLSAALGKMANRTTFIQKWWFDAEHTFGAYLKTQYEDQELAATHEQRFAETAAELTALVADFDRFQSLAIAWYEKATHGGSPAETHGGAPTPTQAREAAARLTAEYAIPPANLPVQVSMEALHRLTPYASEKLNRLRSKIFLCSLRLHECAIRANARYFRTNLSTFVDMVKGKFSARLDPVVAAAVWRSFFFCIPVVSVTLASFQRQFPKMGRGSIGWLLLDEAGQATLPSVCGAVWRAQRCILIGDTLQIPPVVTIPHALDRLLQNHYAITDDCWSPTKHSAQSLADRVTPVGTWVAPSAVAPSAVAPSAHTPSPTRAPIWTGIPLRAHRRCQEPMFSLANTIAYNGQMVQVTPRSAPKNILTGPSGWFHIAGTTPLEGHIIAEELEVAEDLVQKLTAFKVFLISPFRSIADRCAARYPKDKEGRVECGTIHTFQGKEAEIVLLILGTAPENKKARNWVAASPNILNVAVTRARDRLYVIGNRDTWATHRYFDHLAAVLPVREHGLLL